MFESETSCLHLTLSLYFTNPFHSVQLEADMIILEVCSTFPANIENYFLFLQVVENVDYI